MDRSFIIPIAVAAGVHSLLFVSGTPDKPTTPPAPAAEKVVWKELDLPPLEPEILETRDSGEPATEAPPPPKGIGLPDPSFDPGSIVQPYELTDLLPPTEGPVSDRILANWRDALPSAGSGGPIGVIHLDNPPATRFQPAPAYPRDLRSTGTDGTATVVFSVDVNGSVYDATVSRASHSSFGEEALRAVRRWRFDPGLKDGKRVPFRMIQTFSFTLPD